MKRKTPPLSLPVAPMPRLPDWVLGLDTQSPEGAALAAGSALTALHLALQTEGVPHALWQARLALVASEACARMAGRRESLAAMRDEVHLLRPGEAPGPGGAIALAWLRAVDRPLREDNLHRALPQLDAVQIRAWSAPQTGAPIEAAAQVLQAVLADLPRSESAALILADAALARSLGWRHMLPLLGHGLSRRALVGSAEDLETACARAIVAAARTALTLAVDLTRKAQILHGVAPKLRAKGSNQAVALFLARDALAPGRALVPLMSDRAARRFCDRLVALGAVRELTGRDSFRLYGL